ncbi:hypothetical protein GPJ56_009209 [Histomonas meleagridis]|uniref:uncharacterized protein n=1 Tax=Histomonas meleagridis TaxID=135588 RepID=UPI00355A657C|nr:hypothetical protein GPJ56_009209 [Histomonas meleagridis]KAH0801582.1 hypothetical protein GO595_005581 [Histomonas meleagridis]
MEQEYPVQCILDHYFRMEGDDKVLYFVLLWEDESITAEPSNCLTNCRDLIRDYLMELLREDKLDQVRGILQFIE